MIKQIRTIAFYTLLEAIRNRITWLIAVVVVAAIGFSGFLNELALTEKREIQLALMASFLRFSAVFLLATFVVTSLVREFNDKVLQLVLALPLTRGGYLLGKLVGFTLISMLFAILFGLLTSLLAPPLQSALWTVSLLFECWIIAAFSMLCVITFNQVMPALSSVLGFYLMARSITALELISHQPLLEKTLSNRIMSTMIDVLSAVLPHLDHFTRTEWLVYNLGSWNELLPLLGQSVIYLALLSGAALFDFYRKNL